jgi:hypothetical protein
VLKDRTITLTLHEPIALVPSRTLAERHARKRKEFPHLPEPSQLVRELNQLSRTHGIPVSIDDGDKGWLRLYGNGGCLGVTTTSRGGAYAIAFVDPMNLRNHGALARRVRVTRSSAAGWKA